MKLPHPLSLTAALLAGCAPEEPPHPYARLGPESRADIAAYMADHSDVTFGTMWISQTQDGPVVCGRVSGRNELGGNLGPRRFIWASKGKYLIEGGPGDKQVGVMWSMWCVPEQS